MKKLLLLSLLTLSATSFADIFPGEKGSGYVSVPVQVKGEVVDPSTSDLVIETTSTTGVDGGSIVFDFGQIDKRKDSRVISRFAGFKVKKGSGEAFNAASEDVVVGMFTGSAVAASHKTSDAKIQNVLGSGGEIVYTVSSNATGANEIATGGAKVIDGTLQVDVKLGTAPNTGTILDVSQSLVAYIKSVA